MDLQKTWVGVGGSLGNKDRISQSQSMGTLFAMRLQSVKHCYWQLSLIPFWFDCEGASQEQRAPPTGASKGSDTPTTSSQPSRSRPFTMLHNPAAVVTSRHLSPGSAKANQVWPSMQSMLVTPMQKSATKSGLSQAACCKSCCIGVTRTAAFTSLMQLM